MLLYFYILYKMNIYMVLLMWVISFYFTRLILNEDCATETWKLLCGECMQTMRIENDWLWKYDAEIKQWRQILCHSCCRSPQSSQAPPQNWVVSCDNNKIFYSTNLYRPTRALYNYNCSWKDVHSTYVYFQYILYMQWPAKPLLHTTH